MEDEVDLEKINIGCRVRILDMEYNEEMEYKIVGSTEANKMCIRDSNYSCTYHHPAGIMYQDCTAGSGICCGKAGRLPGDLERGPEIKNAFY